MFIFLVKPFFVIKEAEMNLEIEDSVAVESSSSFVGQLSSLEGARPEETVDIAIMVSFCFLYRVKFVVFLKSFIYRVGYLWMVQS